MEEEQTVKISELENAVSIDGTEVMPIVQSGTTKKITTANLLSEVYSTSEVKTNKVWIDGKPIYRKVIEYQSTTSGNRNISLNVTNYAYIRIANWDYHSGNYIFQNFGSSQSNDLVNLWINGSNIVFTTPEAFKVGTLYIEIEYTKPTE